MQVHRKFVNLRDVMKNGAKASWKMSYSYDQNRCRVCLDTAEKFYPLVGNIANAETSISNMITCCTSLEVEISDDLPNGVCIPCFRIIRIAYNFINQYKESSKILSDSRVKIEQKSEDEIETNNSCSGKKITSSDKLPNSMEQDVPEEVDGNDTVQQISSNVNIVDQSLVEFEEDEIINSKDCEDDIIIQEPEAEQELEPDESEEHILIVTENEDDQTDSNLGTAELQEPLTRYRLCRKIVSRLVCPKCPNRIFIGYDKGYRGHITEKHSKEIISCNLCSETNMTYKDFLKHFEGTHRYQCPICHVGFPKSSARVVHMREHENVIFKPDLKPLMLDSVQEQDIPKDNTNSRRRVVTRFGCPKCPELKPYVNYEKGFVSHMSSHHSHEIFSCNLCSMKNLNIEDFLQHFEQIHRHQCTICYKSFNCISTKLVHMRMHSNIRYDCSYCDKSFHAPWFLKKHMNKHTKTVQYNCNDCDYSSATYDNFRYHLMKHQGPKHLCMYCGQSFLLAVHLKYHMWKHTGDKYFKCDQCSKSYTSGSQLKKHKRLHH